MVLAINIPSMFNYCSFVILINYLINYMFPLHKANRIHVVILLTHVRRKCRGSIRRCLSARSMDSYICPKNKRVSCHSVKQVTSTIMTWLYHTGIYNFHGCDELL